MISFDEVYAFSKGIPGIYSESELHELYKLVIGLEDGASIFEIGVLYGRSASVYFQIAKAGKPFDIYLIDPWVVSESDTYRYFHEMIGQHFRNLPFMMLNMTSIEASNSIADSMYPNLLHIDGDHSPAGIQNDIDCWLYELGRGDVVVFHDYNTLDVDGKTLIFPQIKEVVDDRCHARDWEPLGVHDSQAKFRRK